MDQRIFGNTFDSTDQFPSEFYRSRNIVFGDVSQLPLQPNGERVFIDDCHTCV